MNPDEHMHDANENADELMTMNPPLTMNQANKTVESVEATLADSRQKARAADQLVRAIAASAAGRATEAIDGLLVDAAVEVDALGELRRPLDDPRTNCELLGCAGNPVLLTGVKKTVRTFLNNGQGRDENKSTQHRKQPVELENKNMEVDWAPATPPRDSTRPSARARLQNMNRSEAHLVLTLKGGKQHKMKTKRKGMDCENMNKTFKWVTSTLSQENLDYISSQPSYVLMMGSNPGGDGNKNNKDNGNKKNGV